MSDQKEFPSDKADKFVVRLPDGMRDRIKRDASESGRSMNAQIIYMLQSHFERMDKEASEIQKALKSGSIATPESMEINAALLKVLKFEERSILMGRVERLGGTQEVIKSNKAEIAKKIDGESITRTKDENISYYSKIVGEIPMTALLTTDEIQKIAERYVEIQAAQKNQQLKK